MEIHSVERVEALLTTPQPRLRSCLLETLLQLPVGLSATHEGW